MLQTFGLLWVYRAPGAVAFSQQRPQWGAFISPLGLFLITKKTYKKRPYTPSAMNGKNIFPRGIAKTARPLTHCKNTFKKRLCTPNGFACPATSGLPQ
jgi:hypothetical protein